jgi:hypothetical protein
MDNKRFSTTIVLNRKKQYEKLLKQYLKKQYETKK